MNQEIKAHFIESQQYHITVFLYAYHWLNDKKLQVLYLSNILKTGRGLLATALDSAFNFQMRLLLLLPYQSISNILL
jgi:hypothetical protein